MITQPEKLAFELGIIAESMMLPDGEKELHVIELCEKIAGMNKEHGLEFYKELETAMNSRIVKEMSVNKREERSG